MSETPIPYTRKLNYDQLLSEIIDKETEQYTRESFHAAMDSGNFMWPTTPDRVMWWEEWFNLHPEEQKKADILIAEANQKSAADYQYMKLMLRMFFEDHRQAQVSVFVINYNEKSKTVKVIDPSTAEHTEFKL